MMRRFASGTRVAKRRHAARASAADRFVPARFSQALYDAARARKRLLLVDGASHNNSMRVAPDEYRDALFALFGLSSAGEPETAHGAANGSRARLSAAASAR